MKLILSLLCTLSFLCVYGQKDSMEIFSYTGEFCEYECYFPQGKYDKEILKNTLDLFLLWRNVDVPDCQKGRYNEIYQERLAKIFNKPIINTPFWLDFRKRILIYNNLQDERELIVKNGMKDPRRFYDYVGLAKDTMMLKSVELLINSNEQEFVKKTKQFTRDLYSLPSNNDKNERLNEIEYTYSMFLHRIEHKDSVAATKDHLYAIISSRINTQVHKKMDDINSGVRYHSLEDKFNQLFDTVRVFNCYEP